MRGALIAASQPPMRMGLSPANLRDYRAGERLFTGLAAYDGAPKSLTGIGSPEGLVGEAVTIDFFPVLGVMPMLGRNFLPEEDHEGGNRVVIVTHEFWQRRLGGDLGVLDRSIMLDGRP